MLLPIVEPKYQTVPSFASTSAILHGNDAINADHWFFSNCLGIYLQEYQQEYGYNYNLHISKVMGYAWCRLLASYMMPRHMLKSIEHVRELIRDGYYIVLLADMYYIKNCESVYMTHSFPHEVLICGYDGDRYLCGGFFSKAKRSDKYTLEYVDGEDLTDAIWKLNFSQESDMGARDYLRGVHFMKYNKLMDYPMRYDLIQDSLDSHLAGKKAALTDFHFTDYEDTDRLTFGIKVYGRMKEMIIEQDAYVARVFHSLYVHAMILSDAIHEIAPSDASLSEAAQSFVQSAKIIRNHVIKRMISGNTANTEKIVSLLDQCRVQDERASGALLEKVLVMPQRRQHAGLAMLGNH